LNSGDHWLLQSKRSALTEGAESDQRLVESIGKRLFALTPALQSANRVLQHQRLCASGHFPLSGESPEQLKRCSPRIAQLTGSRKDPLLKASATCCPKLDAAAIPLATGEAHVLVITCAIGSLSTKRNARPTQNTREMQQHLYTLQLCCVDSSVLVPTQSVPPELDRGILS